ncbi:insulinase family protein [Sansalvadorimonas sp. 2012CJ34-2]|uniref:Protease 3 n=1 Tax=Parendozoicomonas callyspongiae TaxID=2942213 RepID=A0ABT0PJ06_9GAMM|nr:insulinase family protein [Sansalvadorimonas sp. 2012CJ34-2]MCL6271216.1 insulinase family protein [Sansalvadorimonas sp. 2012CJ34-2]
MTRFLNSAIAIVTIFLVTACQTNAAPSFYARDEIVKSPNDPREYRYLKLDNGVQVALVSSETTNSSAVAINVHAGSSQEPDEWPGLAHLLEHMLFLGSDKYPGADDFDSFLSDHGGSSNAWTSDTDTIFYLTIPNAHYADALERVSRFFIFPKMDPDFLERERHAVDSEFQIYRQQDGRRFHLIERATANPKHPANRFSVGNLNTLKDHDGLSLREALLKFHDQWYFGANISVAIVSNASLDEMEQLARANFSPVRAVKEIKPRPKLPPRFSKKELGVRVDSLAQQQMRNLSLEFYLPTDPHAVYLKPLPYIAHLLGHEARGSLASILKKKGWIQDLVAYNEDNTLDANITLEMSLTKEGFERINDITGQVFAYIDLIKKHGVTQTRFDELKQEYGLVFQFLEQGSAEEAAISLASSMALLPPRDLIQSRYIFRKFVPEKIRNYLNMLTPDNMRMRVATHEALAANEEQIQTEPWMGGRYTIRSLSKAEKSSLASARPDSSLALPPPNPFMPDDLSIVDEKSAEKPQLLMAQPGFKSWFLHDNDFNVPRSSIILRFAAPHLVDSPENVMRMALFDNLFYRSFTETAYMASLGGLDYNFGWDDRGFVLQFFGYSDKLPLFLSTVLTQARQLKISDEELARSKEELEEAINNKSKEDPSHQLFRTMRKLLYPLEFDDSKKLLELKNTSTEDLQEWVGRLFNQLSIAAFIHGNVKQSTAESITNSVAGMASGPDNNNFKTFPKIIRDEPEFPICFISYDKDDSALMVFSQSEKRDHKARAVYQVMASIISSPFYAQLRTKEQLGYIVWAHDIEQSQFPGMAFIIQSPSTLPEQLDDRVTAFLKQFNESVSGLTDETLQQHKEGIIANLTEPNPNLFAATDDYWTDIDSGYPKFDQTEKLVDATNRVTVKDIQALYARILKRQKQFRIYGYGKGSISENAPPACNAPDFRDQFLERVSR